jgi:hypothetical protein
MIIENVIADGASVDPVVSSTLVPPTAARRCVG